MGNYTPTFKFYKPDPGEFVDVDVQLNANWDIADEVVKRLLEYEFTNVQYPDISNARSARAKFYRQYSNSPVIYFKSGNFWYQDPVAYVAPFDPMLTWFLEGYNYSPTNYDVSARLVKNSGGSTATVEWSGAFWELGGTMELNTNTTIIGSGGIPAQYRPAVTKYFNVYAGNTGSDFSVARLLIGSDGGMQFKRYGVDPSAGVSGENRVELTGVVYNVEVTG